MSDKKESEALRIERAESGTENDAERKRLGKRIVRKLDTR
jgi:hypothetical protein